MRDHFKKSREVIDVDGARVKFEGGWGLIRASNTQPALVLRFEALTTEGLEAIKREVAGVLAHSVDVSGLMGA